MNEMLMRIADLGFSEICRTLCIALGAGMMVWASFWYGTKLGLTQKQQYQIMLIVYPLLLGALELINRVSLYVADIGFMGIAQSTNSGIKVFVLLPAASWIICKILKLDWNVISDLVGVMQIAEYPVCTLGCIFTGCCRGYPCEWGLYSPVRQIRYFPVQIINALIMLSILTILLYRAKKLNYRADGRQMPYMMIMFGVTRTITELFMDIQKPIMGLSVIAWYSIVITLIGCCLLLKRKHNTPDENADIFKMRSEEVRNTIPGK